MFHAQYKLLWKLPKIRTLNVKIMKEKKITYKSQCGFSNDKLLCVLYEFNNQINNKL